jgi:hypothetical protein
MNAFQERGVGFLLIESLICQPADRDRLFEGGILKGSPGRGTYDYNHCLLTFVLCLLSFVFPKQSPVSHISIKNQFIDPDSNNMLKPNF